jgi:DNA/RNA-binding protein KIN17
MRNALSAGQNFRQTQDEFSREFQKNFLQLLKTGHGEKEIQINRFYQEVIADKTHVHLNSTKWSSLTEFAKHLGRESLCRVEEKEDGLFIAWIDTSPEALKRKEAVRRKEQQDRGDEEREQMLLREQIRRAQQDALSRGARQQDEEEPEKKELQRQEGEKIKLYFGAKPSPKADDKPAKVEAMNAASGDVAEGDSGLLAEPAKTGEPTALPKGVSLKLGSAKPQAKNVFQQAKKNAFGGGAVKKIERPEKMSEAKRIMLEEIRRKEEVDKRKQISAFSAGPPPKRPRF